MGKSNRRNAFVNYDYYLHADIAATCFRDYLNRRVRLYLGVKHPFITHENYFRNYLSKSTMIALTTFS
jgi:hypothetical protein